MEPHRDGGKIQTKLQAMVPQDQGEVVDQLVPAIRRPGAYSWASRKILRPVDSIASGRVDGIVEERLDIMEPQLVDRIGG